MSTTTTTTPAMETAMASRFLELLADEIGEAAFVRVAASGTLSLAHEYCDANDVLLEAMYQVGPVPDSYEVWNRIWAIAEELMRGPEVVHLAMSPCYPRFAVLVDDKWDTECASNSKEETLAAAREKYPHADILDFDHPEHYCNK